MLPGIDERRHLIPFRAQLLPQIFTDTLVIGSGVAGLRTAIEAAKHGDAILIAKDRLDLSNTAWARGGIAAAHGPSDDASAHAADTMDAGAGLCNPAVVQALADAAPAAIDELLSWGMRFDRSPSGAIHYGREAAHRRSRVLHTDGAATGRELARCLIERGQATSGLRLFDRCFALDLLTARVNGEPNGEPVLGAITHHPKYGLQMIWASATILATGGAGQVFRETTNPKVATGDGIAMAYRAGAEIADTEMIQFHPTTLYVAGAGRSLISEAVRGEGALLVDQDGQRFMPEYHADAELAPRDVVSRAIVDRIARTHAACVYLDARPMGAARLESRFPDLLADLRDFDLDPSRDLIPVHPSAHYTIGGIRTDIDGRTSVRGLYACGEVACNGLHGANRLASNSLAEGLVFGLRAARAAHADMARAGTAPTPIRIVSEIPTAEHAELDLVDVRSSLRSAMWRNVGIERRGNRLEDVKDMFRFWARYTMDRIFDDPDGWETQNLLTVGALVTRGARWRCESRGVHCRLDHPAVDDERFAAHASWRIGRVEPTLTPVAGAEAVEA